VFSIFKKKAFPTDDTWTLAAGTLNKKPVTIRQNVSASSLIGCADYKYRVTVTIAMIDAQSSGLPTGPECDYLGAIETAVGESLEAGQDALHVLSVTIDGVRDLIFHSRAPLQIEAKLKAIRQRFPYRQITSSIEVDRRWRVFKQFSKMDRPTP
jgi:hypothetical protein